MRRGHMDLERSFVGPFFVGQEAARLRFNFKQCIELATWLVARFFGERNQQRTERVRASGFGDNLRDHIVIGGAGGFGGRGGEDTREQAAQSSRWHKPAAITTRHGVFPSVVGSRK